MSIVRRTVSAGLVFMAVVGATVTAPQPATARGPIDVSVDARSPGGRTMAAGAVGLSMEVSSLTSSELTAPQGNLAALMRLLGPATLRVGGCSADRAFWTSTNEPPPAWAESVITPAAIGLLADLARAAGWRVILTVNLGHFDPLRAADEAAVAAQLLGPSLLGIEVGNEPDLYPGHFRPKGGYGYDEYAAEQRAYKAAIHGTVPQVPVVEVAGARDKWLDALAASPIPGDGDVDQHFYGLPGCAGQHWNSDDLLDSSVRAREDSLLDALKRVSAATGRHVTIGETNSVSCGGSTGVSPTFASALWALDWTLRSIRAGVERVEFHDHFGVCSPATYSPLCAVDEESRRLGQFSPRAEFYALIAARNLENSRFVPVTVHGSPTLTGYGARSAEGDIRLVLVNLSTSRHERRVNVRVAGRFRASSRLLRADDLDATANVTLAGKTIGERAAWQRVRSTTERTGALSQTRVPSASAALITLHRLPAR